MKIFLETPGLQNLHLVYSLEETIECFFFFFLPKQEIKPRKGKTWSNQEKTWSNQERHGVNQEKERGEN